MNFGGLKTRPRQRRQARKGSLDQATILDAEQAITSACEMLIVSDDDQRPSIVASDLQQQLDDRLARMRIEISGRFVCIDN